MPTPTQKLKNIAQISYDILKIQVVFMYTKPHAKNEIHTPVQIETCFGMRFVIVHAHLHAHIKYQACVT